MELRDYQQKAIDKLFDWFEHNQTGNPCLVLPTGAGKSHIIASFCKTVVQQWPNQRLLMVTHVKELIEQNAEKMRQHWPNAPLGIYSAGLGQRNIQNITFGGIQSLKNKATELGFFDLIIIDECHLVGHKTEGGYRDLINDLTAINPRLRVIGLTATPFRLGHGYIHEGDGVIFTDLIEPVLIEDLIYQGYLSPLRSKMTAVKLLTDGVHKRGGDYIESELQAAVDKPELNHGVVSEIIKHGQNRRSWLIFCAGVEHAQHICEQLVERDIVAACVTGKTSAVERALIIADFKAGNIRAVVNVSVLTTGFDAPNTDLIAMLRPTESPALYMQMAGRGLRLKDHCPDCLVLDFAGNVITHGPITCVTPPNKKGEGQAPTKDCPECDEIVHISIMVCPCCDYQFPPPEPKEGLYLRDDDIMHSRTHATQIRLATWSVHTSKKTGAPMLKCKYYSFALVDQPIDQYFGVYGYDQSPHYQNKCRQEIGFFLKRSKIEWDFLSTDSDDIHELCSVLSWHGIPPLAVHWKMDGKYKSITQLDWMPNYEP